MARLKPQMYLQMGGLVVILIAAGFIITASPDVFAVKYDKSERDPKKEIAGVDKKDEQQDQITNASSEPKIVVTHLKTPSPLKSIYMSQCVVGTRDFRERLVKVADTTEINSILIDIKDYTGKISFDTDNPKLAHAVSPACGATDMLEFIDYLHKKGIYVIGRITVFQDPYMTAKRPDLAVQSLSTGSVWKDFKGLSFVDVGAREHWDYIIELAKESYKIGFDEINFDYIRFPSDGKMDDTDYTLSRGKTKPEALEEFFSYLQKELEPVGVVTSADLFGMVTTSRNDLNIGQVLERALPHFDYIAPMVYPSHYPKNFNGWGNPNTVPYELIKFVMTSAVERADALDRAAYAEEIGTTTPALTANFTRTSYKKLRPWLQDFDYGGNYDIAEVRAQIQATYDSGLDSWMLWAPSNIYTVGALDKD